MNRKQIVSKETHAVLLKRMAESRTALIATNMSVGLPARSPTAGSTARNVATALIEAPHVALVLVLVAGALILGPRRTLAIASRSGLTTWIARNVRQLIP